MTVDDALHDQVRDWIAADPDAETRREARQLLAAALAGDAAAEAQLRDAFGGRLAFGTAGLRAELGAGPARMNRVVVAQTSAGFAEFLRRRAAAGVTTQPPSVVIGYDARSNSDVFARDAAEIMAGAGIAVTLLPEAMPTPVTAFAVRELRASAGVMITASHNPPRDNGYKVFLGDADAGSQIIPPSDQQIATLIERAAALPYAELPRSQHYTIAGEDLRRSYVTQAAAAVRAGLSDAELPEHAQLRVAYTALHGVGAAVAREVYHALGLPVPTPTPEQDQPDGRFPTVAFPNPEEPGALDLVFRAAREVDADVVVAHDPDADRLAVALPDPAAQDGYRALTGNELGVLLGWRAAQRAQARAQQTGTPVRGTLACSSVSTPALRAIATAYGLGYAETLPGFKWVSRVPELLFWIEEAIGYLTHPEVVRDKDGILASAEAIALARECKAAHRTLWDLLDEAAMRFGYFVSAQVVVRLGSAGEVAALAARIRAAPPTGFGSFAVARAHDFLTPGLSAVPANMLSYELSNDARVMIRPSGTEPKLKIYLDACASDGDLPVRRARAHELLVALERDVRGYLEQI